jgi:hypothetical protein
MMGVIMCFVLIWLVIPAKAGTQQIKYARVLDSGLRRNDDLPIAGKGRT